MWKSIMLILLFASIAGIIEADDEARWPPDPEVLFPQNLIWSEVEPRHFTAYGDITIEHMLEVRFSDGRVEQYDLPDMMRVSEVVVRPDENVLVFVEGVQQHHPDLVFLLNTETGLYERLPTVCEDLVSQSQSGRDGEWVLVYRDEAFTDGILCHSRTGEMREGVPPYLYYPPSFNRPAYPELALSPNGESLVVVSVTDETGRQIVVYAYDLVSDTWTQLGNAGDVPFADVVSTCGWVSDTKGLICAGFNISGRSINTNYYRFDLREPDTLELAFTGWGTETVTVFDNRQRYIAIRSENDSALRGAGLSSEAPPCTVTFYDARYYYQEKVGYECIPSFTDDYNRKLLHHQNDTLYFLSIDSPNVLTSNLQQIILTRPDPNIHLLLTGEIEAVLSIAPDTRHVVVLMDDNGSLDFPYQSTICCDGRDHWLVTIISAEEGRIVYQSPPVAVHTADQVWWLDAQTFILITADSIIHRVVLHERGVDLATTSRYAIDRQQRDTRLISQRYWLFPDEYDVLDMLIFERLPILTPEALAMYDVSMHSLDGDAVQVTIASKEGAGSVVYQISFDETE